MARGRRETAGHEGRRGAGGGQRAALGVRALQAQAQLDQVQRGLRQAVGEARDRAAGGGRAGLAGAAQRRRVAGQRRVVAELHRQRAGQGVHPRPLARQRGAGQRLPQERVAEPQRARRRQVRGDHQHAEVEEAAQARLDVAAADVDQHVALDRVAEQRRRAGHPADEGRLAGEGLDQQAYHVVR
ncbi:hypothetical protein Dfulv_10725 [Dactylosporangium fulvum]|uniref:Uncharacterized protein n=1 Tax=Dactylosporangium fulvum TaxID=53359 RepID=A0ABY5W552_9ACTN|nr:hypothetical protein [Dactylosporangium fulvum]UWP84672.1 hypothetical protein Dfulv_10725 [Dactylosporangium fulvum]